MVPQKTPPFPDPKIPRGPYRPFTCDPGWSEAWWWLGIPLLVAVFTIGSYWLNPGWYDRVVLPEGCGILELSHFVIPVIGLWIAVRLVFDPFVRARPFVLTVSIIGALSSFYIAGEEMSWGQHFFHWNTPEYWAEVNRQQETNLHNTYAIFEKTPRSILELGIAIGGLGVPLAAYFYPWLRACRVSLFLSATALLPTAMGAMFFKLVDRIQQSGAAKLLDRPSETIETYLYVFIITYLGVYARRIRQLKTDGVHAAAATHVRYGSLADIRARTGRCPLHP